MNCSAHSNSQICCLGWGVNFIDAPAVTKSAERLAPRLNLDDFFSQKENVNGSDLLCDLPRDLAVLDVEAALPKLSPLSSGGKE